MSLADTGVEKKNPNLRAADRQPKFTCFATYDRQHFNNGAVTHPLTPNNRSHRGYHSRRARLGGRRLRVVAPRLAARAPKRATFATSRASESAHLPAGAYGGLASCHLLQSTREQKAAKV